MARLASSIIHKTSKLGQKSSRLVPKLLPTKLRHCLSNSKKIRRSKTPPSQSTCSFVDQLIAPHVDRVIRIHYNDPSPEFENRLNSCGTGEFEICHYCTFQLLENGVKTACGHLCCIRCAGVTGGPCEICGEDDLDAFDWDYAYHPAHSMINGLFDNDVDELNEPNSINKKTCREGEPDPICPIDVNEFATRWANDNKVKSKSGVSFPENGSTSAAEILGIWSFPAVHRDQNRNGNHTRYCSLFDNSSMIREASIETASTSTEQSESVATIPSTSIDVMVVLSAPRTLKAGNPYISPFQFEKNASFGVDDGMTHLVGLVPITGINKKVIKAAIQNVNKNLKYIGSDYKFRVGLMVAWDRNHGKEVAAVFLLAQRNLRMITK